MARVIAQSKFANELNGSYTSFLNQAYAWDKKTSGPSKTPGSYNQQVTYTTKVNFQWDVINSKSQISDEALVIGLVNRVSGGEDGGISDNGLGYALITADYFRPNKVQTLGGKALVHELGHLFGLPDLKSGSIDDAMHYRLGGSGTNFSSDEKVKMLQNAVGNWDYLWRKKTKDVPLNITDKRKKEITIDFGTYKQKYDY